MKNNVMKEVCSIGSVLPEANLMVKSDFRLELSCMLAIVGVLIKAHNTFGNNVFSSERASLSAFSVAKLVFRPRLCILVTRKHPQPGLGVLSASISLLPRHVLILSNILIRADFLLPASPSMQLATSTLSQPKHF